MFGEYQFVQAQLKLPGMVENKIVSSNKICRPLDHQDSTEEDLSTDIEHAMLFSEEGKCWERDLDFKILLSVSHSYL